MEVKTFNYIEEVPRSSWYIETNSGIRVIPEHSKMRIEFSPELQRKFMETDVKLMEKISREVKDYLKEQQFGYISKQYCMSVASGVENIVIPQLR